MVLLKTRHFSWQLGWDTVTLASPSSAGSLFQSPFLCEGERLPGHSVLGEAVLGLVCL